LGRLVITRGGQGLRSAPAGPGRLRYADEGCGNLSAAMRSRHSGLEVPWPSRLLPLRGVVRRPGRERAQAAGDHPAARPGGPV